MNKQKQIIINADDFGLSDSVNQAVYNAHKKGILTSATIMANMPGFDQAVNMSKELPTLGIGVHLNLLRGKPLNKINDIHSLTNKNGDFFGNVINFAKALYFGKIKESHIKKELKKQIEKVIDNGIKPTHVDSEKHLHLLFPKLGRIICETIGKYNINKIRITRETVRLLPKKPIFKQFLKMLILNRQSSILESFARQYNIRSTNAFFGVSMTGKMEPDIYLKLLNKLDSEPIEIMCHPAITENAAKSIGEISWLDQMRFKEYRALIDPQVVKAYKNSNIKLINYSEL